MERNGKPGETVGRDRDWDRDWDRDRDRDRDGAFQYSRRGLRLRRRGAYGIHRASGPRCQGLCRKVASLRSGGRRLAVRIAMEHPIGALPRTPFPASRDFPSRGNERYEGKNGESYTSCTIPEFPPLVAGATTFPPQFGGAAKGKRLNGQARRLTSPHLEVLCRTSTGHNKAP